MTANYSKFHNPVDKFSIFYSACLNNPKPQRQKNLKTDDFHTILHTFAQK